MNQFMIDMEIQSYDWIICAVCMIPVTIALVITAYQAFNLKYRYFFYSSALWLATLLFGIFFTSAVYFGSKILLIFGFYILIPGEICLLMKADIISRETIGALKLSVYAILAPLGILLMMYQDGLTIVVENVTEIHFKGTFLGTIGYMLILLPPNLDYFYILFKVNAIAPRNLRRYSVLFLTGFIINAILSPLVSAFIPFVWSGQLFIGVGSLLVAITVAKQPKILFVLPFKVIRLSVLNTDSGVSMYTHDWSKEGELANEHLYAGMLQGVGLIIKESLHRGEVRDIHMDKAVLMIDRNVNHPVASVLVVTKASRVIRDGLQLFAKKFYKEHSEHLGKKIHDMSKFEDSTRFIEECFPFIPEYD